MAEQILDNSSYVKLLKSIRTAARENGGKIAYTELKTYFENIALTPKQAENLWIFLDSNCIMVDHIDEFDSLFASVPESEAPEEAQAPAAHAPEASARKQDVSNVGLHSTAIGEELLRRAFKNAEKDADEAFIENNRMAAARKLASKLRPNEMYALYLLWGLDGKRHTADQVSEVTEIPLSTFSEIETRAASCTPKLPGQKKGFFASLFGR